MENWKDNNLSAILEYPFDFERYIEERLGLPPFLLYEQRVFTGSAH